MVIIGLLLIIASVIFGADMVWQNTYHITSPVAFGTSLGLTRAAAFYALGAITGAALLLGIVLLTGGLGVKGRNAAKRRREQNEMAAATANDQELARLRADNERLRRDLAAQPVVQPRETVVSPAPDMVVAEHPVEVESQPVVTEGPATGATKTGSGADNPR